MRCLIRQAIAIPIFFLLPVFIAGLFADDFDWISQHASAISLMDSDIANVFLSTGAIASGVSSILLAVGIFTVFRAKHSITPFLLVLFGASMISNGIYPMGNPMHGLYGIGICMMLLPFVACYELKGNLINPSFYSVSLVSGGLIFIYCWLLLVGLDPVGYRGLTQRIFGFVNFGWIAYAAYQLHEHSLSLTPADDGSAA